MQLSKEELEKIEKEFAKEFERNPEKMIARYRATFGNYISNDKALEVCSAYKDAPDEQKRVMADSINIRQITGKIIYGVFDQMLKEPPPAGVENIVSFIAGGPGAGKTHIIRENPTIAEVVHKVSHIAFEVVGGLKEANIEKVLNAGKDALLLFVHRPIEAAARGAIERAEKEGRATNFDYLCRGHLDSQREAKFLLQTYQHNEGFIGAIVDNKKDGEARMLEPNTRQALEFLQNNAYKNIEQVKNRGFHAVKKFIKEREKEGNPIDKDLEQHFIGKEQEARAKQAQQLREQREQEKDPDKTR